MSTRYSVRRIGMRYAVVALLGDGQAERVPGFSLFWSQRRALSTAGSLQLAFERGASDQELAHQEEVSRLRGFLSAVTGRKASDPIPPPLPAGETRPPRPYRVELDRERPPPRSAARAPARSAVQHADRRDVDHGAYAFDSAPSFTDWGGGCDSSVSSSDSGSSCGSD